MSSDRIINDAIKKFVQEARDDLKHNDLVSAYNNSSILHKGTRFENYTFPEALYKFFLEHDINPIEHFAEGKEIPLKAFSGFRSKRKFTLPDSIECVRRSAFSYCNLKIPNLPKNLKVIELDGFSSCKNLTITEWPQNLEEIGAMAFEEVHILNGNLPDKLRTIGRFAFNYCKDLTEIVIPASVTTIEAQILHCSPIEKITFLGTPTQIDPDALRLCIAKEIYVPWSENEVDIIFPDTAKVYYNS